MPPRRLLHFDIADRQQELRDLVAPDDFLLARRDTPCPFPENALAYCADMQAERVLYTLHGAALPTLFSAPFLYSAQLRGAAQVVSVPFEQVADIDPDTACRPTLIFSPGRTGSTLLVRLLAACGQACASEPDMLTQICRFQREDRLRIGPAMEVALLRACMVALCRALGPAPFIKLRSHCNGRPLPLMEAAGGQCPVLLMRALGPWALSRHRAFTESPASVASVLRQTADAIDKLFGLPTQPLLLWFEDMRRDPITAIRVCLGGGSPDEAAVAAAMKSDSQAGTAIARDALVAAVSDPDFSTAFEVAWASARAGAQWSSATEAILAKAAAR
jgi:hypothetical protein